jgi:hypothetical protein
MGVIHLLVPSPTPYARSKDRRNMGLTTILVPKPHAREV